MMMMKKLLPALAAVALIAALSANAAPTHPVGRIVTPKGELLFYLYPQTPNHMASFIKLAGSHAGPGLSLRRSASRAWPARPQRPTPTTAGSFMARSMFSRYCAAWLLPGSGLPDT